MVNINYLVPIVYKIKNGSDNIPEFYYIGEHLPSFILRSGSTRMDWLLALHEFAKLSGDDRMFNDHYEVINSIYAKAQIRWKTHLLESDTVQFMIIKADNIFAKVLYRYFLDQHQLYPKLLFFEKPLEWHFKLFDRNQNVKTTELWGTVSPKVENYLVEMINDYVMGMCDPDSKSFFKEFDEGVQNTLLEVEWQVVESKREHKLTIIGTKKAHILKSFITYLDETYNFEKMNSYEFYETNKSIFKALRCHKVKRLRSGPTSIAAMLATGETTPVQNQMGLEELADHDYI